MGIFTNSESKSPLSPIFTESYNLFLQELIEIKNNQQLSKADKSNRFWNLIERFLSETDKNFLTEFLSLSPTISSKEEKAYLLNYFINTLKKDRLLESNITQTHFTNLDDFVSKMIHLLQQLKSSQSTSKNIFD
jgi:hypothetical protein